MTYLTYSSLRNSKADSKQKVQSVKQNNDIVSKQGSHKSNKKGKKTVVFKNQALSEDVIEDFFKSDEETVDQQNLSEI